MTSAAKPYANAAFEIAVQDKQLDSWSECLSLAALIAENKTLHQLLCDPQVSKTSVLDIFFELLKNKLDAKVKTFLQLLMQYQRINLLPSIAAEYHRLLAEHNNTVNAKVYSAIALTSAQEEQLKTALAKHFDAKVALQCEVNENLLAGAVVRVGDTVIDGSARGRLKKFEEVLVTN